MNSRDTTIHAIVASFFVMGVVFTAPAHNASVPGESEKCYCVARAGQPDCGIGNHDCASLAKVDYDPEEWKMVAKGTCAKVAKPEPKKP